MKKLLALALLSVAFVGCGGKGGLPACTSKHEVKEILTGVKQGCSGSAGIVKAALTSNPDEAAEDLQNTFIATTEFSPGVFVEQVTALRNGKFYSIIKLGDKFYANLGIHSEIIQLNNGNFFLTYDFVNENGDIIRPQGALGPVELEFNFNEDGDFLAKDGLSVLGTLFLNNSPYPLTELEDIEIVNSFEE